MSWITIVWAMDAGACLTLAAIHLLIGLRQKGWANLVISLTAAAAAATAGLELALMRATTPERHGELIRWAHLPVWVIVVCLVIFVRLYLRAGRPWLGWAAIGTRTLSLVINFLVTPNLNYERITAIRPLSLWGGETIFVAEGVFREWTRLGQASLLILLAFIVDATRTVWRRGDRQRGLVVGGSMILFMSVATVHTALVTQGIIRSPYLISIAFLGVVGAMSYELSSDILRASELARDVVSSRDALQESERRMALAADAAGIGMWVWEIPSDELWMSDRGRALRGYNTEERLDFQRYMSCVHPDDRNLVRRHVEESLAKVAEFEREYRIVLPGGEVRWISARGRVEPDANGKPVRMRGASIDITRRKIAELEVALQRNELTHLSRVAMLGELSGTLAHELNQPLAAILFSAQAAQRFRTQVNANPREIDAILERIVAQDKHASEVILRMGTLLRKGEVNLQSLNLGEVVGEAVRVVQADLASQGVAVSIELSPDLPQVRADRVQMQQVLLNLVLNGCNAMAGTEAEARQLLIRTDSPGGGEVRVRVSDRGCGIPADDLERIFEPFVTTKAAGLGLGLAVCRTIVSAHRGRLSAVNNADGGATFSLTLPAADGPRT